MRISCAIALWLWLFLAGAGMLTGGQLDEDYLVTPFTVEDGLPQNTVIDIEQTPDGYLWLGTYAGLVRFDGVQFTTFDSVSTPALSGTGIFGLDLDSTGCLWIVSDEWRLTRLQNGVFERCSGRFGLPDVPVSTDGQGPGGQVSFGHSPETAEEFWFEKGQFKVHSSMVPLPDHFRGPLTVNRWGSVWWQEGTNWNHRKFQSLGALLPESNGTNKLRIARPRREGGFWAVTSWGLYGWQDGQWIRQNKAPVTMNSCSSMIEDKTGHLWIGTWSQGLWRIDPDGQFHLYSGSSGKSFSAIRGLFEDREGNIWIGTEGNGLLRVRKRFCYIMDANSGLAGEQVTSVSCDTNDRVWVMMRGKVDRIDTKAGNKITHVQEVGFAWDLYCDPKGQLYAGNYAGDLWSEKNGVLAICGGTNMAAAVTSLQTDGQGTLLVGTADGLWEMTNGSLRRQTDFSSKEGVKTMMQAADGSLYVGTSGGGLWRRQAGQWSVFPNHDLNDVRALLPESGQLWLGTQQKGLWRVQGEESYHYDRATTGLPRQISCLIEDNFGFLWCGSAQGIYRASQQDLNSLAQGSANGVAVCHYGRSDGLLSSECASGRQQTVCKTSDGRLWFATSEGLAVINPSDLITNTLPPPVLIESARIINSPRAGGPERAMDMGAAPFAAPPGNNRLQVHYTALSFIAPERVQFRFRLDGLDHGWTDAGTRRVADYQSLKPGHYNFRVIACNNDGVWSPEGASLAFSIQPWFWQTDWFNALVVAVIFALVCLVYRIRWLRLAEVNRLRLRIARDLHDEIGANLGSIGLNVQLLMSDPAVSGPHRRDLAVIDQVTVQTAQAARDIVWMTNPDFDNVGGMVGRMRELAALMLAGRKWTFDGPTEGLSDPLPIDLRRNVFFAFKECLHNIVKHSKAQDVGIVLRCDRKAIELSVRDNGQGFEPAATTSGTGLRNLRRRAEETGGAVTIESGKGAGVSIRLRMPIRRRRSWLKWFVPHE